MRKNSKKLAFICSVLAAVCFGIVSCGNFYRGERIEGYLLAAVTF